MVFNAQDFEFKPFLICTYHDSRVINECDDLVVALMKSMALASCRTGFKSRHIDDLCAGGDMTIFVGVDELRERGIVVTTTKNGVTTRSKF